MGTWRLDVFQDKPPPASLNIFPCTFLRVHMHKKKKSRMECTLCLFVHYKQDSLFSLSWLWTLIYRAVCKGIAANSLVCTNHVFPCFLYRAPNPLTHPVEASHTIHIHLITPHFYSARMLYLPVFKLEWSLKHTYGHFLLFGCHPPCQRIWSNFWLLTSVLGNI